MKVTEVDKTSFKEACQKVYEQYSDEYGTQIAEIQALLAD